MNEWMAEWKPDGINWLTICQTDLTDLTDQVTEQTGKLIDWLTITEETDYLTETSRLTDKTD